MEDGGQYCEIGSLGVERGREHMAGHGLSDVLQCEKIMLRRTDAFWQNWCAQALYYCRVLYWYIPTPNWM